MVALSDLTAREFDAIDAVLGSRHLVEFVKLAWHILEPVKPYSHNWHIEAICEHLEAVTRGEILNLLVNQPPGSMKTFLVSVLWPAWEWLTKPETRWLFASYGDEASTDASVKCRSVIESDWYGRLWPTAFRLNRSQNQKTRFDNDRKGWRISTSIGGIATGLHPDRKVVDDPVNAKKATSVEMLRTVIRWWKETMSSRGLTRNASSVIVMQRLHQLDLSGFVLEQGGWEHLMLPMEYEPGRSCVTCLGPIDKRTVEGELLWPELLNAEKVKTEKQNLGTFGVAGQFQQLPVPEGGAIFRQTTFKSFTIRSLRDGDVAPVPQVPSGLNRILAATSKQPISVKPSGRLQPWQEMVFELADGEGNAKRVFGWDCWWFLTCDTAMKTKEENDYTAVGTFIVTPDRDLLIYKIVREKIPVPKQYPYLIEQRKRFPWLAKMCIEDAASGTGILQQAQADGMAFTAMSAAREKTVKAANIATLYEQGKVYHLAPGSEHDVSWLPTFEAELLMFPRGEHDDQVDCCSQAGNVLVEHSMQSMGIRDIDVDSLPSMSDLLGADFLVD